MSTHADTGVALDELIESVAGLDPDVAFVFASPDHTRRIAEVVTRLHAAFPGVHLLGCSAAGCVGGGREVESGASVSLTVGELPGVQATPFHVDVSAAPTTHEQWRELTGAEQACFAFSDPYSFDVAGVLDPMQDAMGQGIVVGGQASGGDDPESHALIAGDEVHRSGLVGLGLSGPLLVDACVAQGCRPIGEPMFVSSVDGNLIAGLNGQPAVDVLRDLFRSLSPHDQHLFRNALFLGVQMREQQEYHPGDFLIRNIVGIPKSGSGLVVAYRPERFSVVQLHVRDSDTAHADVEAALAAQPDLTPAGALLFTCVGRGESLFGESGHDSAAYERRYGDVPLGGFFANGEIGPVQGQPFVHGYTSVFASFREQTD